MSKDDLDREVVQLTAAAARLFSQRLTEALKSAGMTSGQYAIVDLLDQTGELTPSALSELLNVETSTVAVTLKRAEAAGLIDRAPDPRDGRGKVVRLTTEGKSRVGSARDAVDRLTRETMGGVPEHDALVAKRVLQIILATLDTHGK